MNYANYLRWKRISHDELKNFMPECCFDEKVVVDIRDTPEIPLDKQIIINQQTTDSGHINFKLSFKTNFPLTRTLLSHLFDEIVLIVGGQEILRYTSMTFLSYLHEHDIQVYSVKTYDDDDRIIYKTIIPYYHGWDTAFPLWSMVYHDVRITVKKGTNHTAIKDCFNNDDSQILSDNIFGDLPKDLVNSISDYIGNDKVIVNGRILEWNIFLIRQDVYMKEDFPDINKELRLLMTQTQCMKMQKEKGICKVTTDDLWYPFNTGKSFTIFLQTNGSLEVQPLKQISFIIEVETNAGPPSIDGIKSYDPVSLVNKTVPGMYYLNCEHDPMNMLGLGGFRKYKVRVEFANAVKDVEYTIRVCYCNYNIFRAIRGMAGLLYSN